MNEQEQKELKRRIKYYTKKDIVGSILSRWRNKKVLPFIHGTLVDVACGNNQLVKWYGSGVGIDIAAHEKNITVVEELEDLPFQTGTVDTVTIIASLNYFPQPELVLREIHRILKPTGKLLLTMANLNVMKIWHIFREPHAYQPGYSEEMLIDILDKSGFAVQKKQYFMLFINAIYLAEKGSCKCAE